MSVEGLGVHDAITDRGDGLDAEEKGIPKATGPCVRDRISAQKIQQGKAGVEHKVAEKGKAEKKRPRHDQKQMVKIAEKALTTLNHGNLNFSPRGE